MRPITAQPGHISADVTAALASRIFVYADCYTITPKVGSPIYYTNAQSDVSVVPIGGSMRQTYKARTVLIAGLKAHLKIGIEVDEQSISLDYSASNDYQAALPWSKALLQGRLDGATIARDRFVALDWAPDLSYPWLGGFPMFRGSVSGATSVGRQSATISVKSMLNVLNRQMPRSLYVAQCKNTWGDAACGVDQSTYAVTATITSAATSTFLPWTSATTGYAGGKVNIDNGDGVTRVRSILKSDTTGIWLVYPLDFAPISGQTFTAYPGCAGTMTRCQDFHGGSWMNYFKGFPFVPTAETGI